MSIFCHDASALLIALCSTHRHCFEKLITIDNRQLIIRLAASLYILTRKRYTEKGPVIEARKVLEDNKITANHLQDTNQVDCDDKSSENSKDA